MPPLQRVAPDIDTSRHAIFHRHGPRDAAGVPDDASQTQATRLRAPSLSGHRHVGASPVCSGITAIYHQPRDDGGNIDFDDETLSAASRSMIAAAADVGRYSMRKLHLYHACQRRRQK